MVACGAPPAAVGPCFEATDASSSAPTPLGVGGADAAGVRRRRAGVPAVWGRLRLMATVEDAETIGAILAAASREEAGRAPPAAATQTLNRAAAPGA